MIRKEAPGGRSEDERPRRGARGIARPGGLRNRLRSEPKRRDQDMQRDTAGGPQVRYMRRGPGASGSGRTLMRSVFRAQTLDESPVFVMKNCFS